MISVSLSRLSGVKVAGLMMTVLPAARAGAIFQMAMRKGKFQGMICPQTPMGSRRTKLYDMAGKVIWGIGSSGSMSASLAKWRKWINPTGMSSRCDLRQVQPPSRISASAISSCRASMASTREWSRRERSPGDISAQ